MKTILVTGGAGFIGSHLCDYLLKRNDRVICVDNLFTGSKKNIEHLTSNENFYFIEHDIVGPLGDLQKKIASLKIEKIDQGSTSFGCNLKKDPSQEVSFLL